MLASVNIWRCSEKGLLVSSSVYRPGCWTSEKELEILLFYIFCTFLLNSLVSNPDLSSCSLRCQVSHIQSLVYLIYAENQPLFSCWGRRCSPWALRGGTGILEVQPSLGRLWPWAGSWLSLPYVLTELKRIELLHSQNFFIRYILVMALQRNRTNGRCREIYIKTLIIRMVYVIRKAEKSHSLPSSS